MKVEIDIINMFDWILSEIYGTPQFFEKYLDVLELGEIIPEKEYMKRIYGRKEHLNWSVLKKLRYLETHKKLGYDNVILDETQDGFTIERVTTTVSVKELRRAVVI